MAVPAVHATPLAGASAPYGTPAAAPMVAAAEVPGAVWQAAAPQQPEAAAAAAAGGVADGTPWQAQQVAAVPPAAGPTPFTFPRYTPAGLRPDDPRIRRISDAEIAKLPTVNRRGDPNRNPFLRLRRG